MSKKIKGFVIGLVLMLSLILVACDPRTFYFNYDKVSDNVLKVELIYYDNSNVKTVEKKEDILPFDFNKMSVIKTLESDRIQSLLLDLSKIHFHVSDELTKYSSSANETSIKISYKNERFLIICSNKQSNFVTEFNSDGSLGELVVRFPNSQDFVDLTNKFFTLLK